MATPYQQRVHQQGLDWVNGRSIHNDVDGECCPDFSCCVPSLYISSRKTRIEIVNKYAKEHGFKLLPEINSPVKGIDKV